MKAAWKEVAQREMKEEEKRLCLYECLKAVGLQHYYSRLTSLGVHSATHLSRLTMEDYPILGIQSMEDRSRLFHLVQAVKTLDFESVDQDDISETDGGAVADSHVTYDGRGDPDEDVFDAEDGTDAAISELDAASFSTTSCVCRRLDFSSDTDQYEKPQSHPAGTVQCGNNDPGQEKGSGIPVHLELNGQKALVYGCKRIQSLRTDIPCCQHNLHKGAITKADTVKRNSLHKSHTRSSLKCVTPHLPKPKPKRVVSKRFSNKLTDGKQIVSEDKVVTPVYQPKRTAGYNYGLPLTTPPAPKRRQPWGHHISVCVRKRPLTRTEGRRGEADIVTNQNGRCVIVHESKEAVDLTQYIRQHRFYFDQVFGEESSNEEVYQRTAYPLVQHMLVGGNATCFAYGQTGAGKTHTMLGSSPRRPGLYALAAQDIFTHFSTTHTHSPLLVYVSFFEIYCGHLYDLLDHRKRVFAREDGQKVVHIAGLRNVRVDSASSLLEVISEGTEERTQGTSGVNPLSSRSHALLQIQLRGPNQQIDGRMWFVDLAGSERASDSKEPDKQCRMEGAEINQSLLALKECIRSLDQEQSHTPFRQSKLTQILKNSFVGDSMTCMIANISPGQLSAEHTLNTLRYANRVKELRGSGRRRGKAVPSPKRNLLNSSSGGNSIFTRGKSPPKKSKLRTEREALNPTGPTSRSTTGGPNLCSTPKTSRRGHETSARPRRRTGLEEVTPIRGVLENGDRREKTGVGRDKRGEKYGGADDADQSIWDQDIGNPEQSTEDKLILLEIHNKSLLCHKNKNRQQSNMKGGEDTERRWMEQRREVENSRDVSSKVKRGREGELQMCDERDKERERHLKWYHQQLQQCMPLSVSSSHHALSTSTCPSLPSSVLPSPGKHQNSFSTLTYHDLENVLDGYKTTVQVETNDNIRQFPSIQRGEMRLQNGSSPGYTKKKDGVDCSTGEDLTGSLEGTDAELGQDRVHVDNMNSLKVTGEREVRVRRPVGTEQLPDKCWAFVEATDTEQTGGRRVHLGPLVSYSCASKVGQEGLHASDVRQDGVWSAGEKEGSNDNIFSKKDRNCLLIHPPVESPHQQAPAERPLSPACLHTHTLVNPNKHSYLSFQLKHTSFSSNILPISLKNVQQGVSSRSLGEKKQLFVTDANRREFASAKPASLLLTTPITLNRYKMPVESLNTSFENPDYIGIQHHPEAKTKMSVFAQGGTSTDSLSYTMDPLTISLLEVDQEVATASFLQGEESKSSPFLLQKEIGESMRYEVDKEHLTSSEIAGRCIEDDVLKLSLSHLEIPNATTLCPPSSTSMTAKNQTEGKKRLYFNSDGDYGISMMRPPTPGVMLLSLQSKVQNWPTQTTPDLEFESKASASSLKPSICASVETSDMQSISSSVQNCGITDSNSSQYLMNSMATQILPNCVPDEFNAKQDHDVHSNQSTISNISIQSNSPTESKGEKNTSNLQIRPEIYLSSLEKLYHDQLSVVQAHSRQLKEMETLCHKERMLLWYQPHMAFEDYVCRLGEIMERKAHLVMSMIAQLQPYLKTSHFNRPHNQGKDVLHQMT